MKQRTECNNINKELYSRKAILEVILSEYGKKSISFLELLGSGSGAEFYSTWLNIKNLDLIEIDKSKYEYFWKNKRLKFQEDYNLICGLWNIDLNKWWNTPARYLSLIPQYDVINLDFCTYLYDNGKENCTASIINNMFKYNAIKDGGLVCFTFMVAGIGVNFHKRDAIIERDKIYKTIQNIANENGYNLEDELLAYIYSSGHPTKMINLIYKVKEIC